MNYLHSFHVPVMGIGYTIDSPLKLAHLGITSVVSLVDDMLMEKMREFHSFKAGLSFREITAKTEDSRAKRITAFLNFLDERVRQKVDTLRNSLNGNIEESFKYFELLPDTSSLKRKYDFLRQQGSYKDLKDWMKENITPGEIDVNIMTKLDRVNYRNHEELPVSYNDAHAAVRGFAVSNLESSLVLSAGMNLSLYNYLGQWSDFFPDHLGNIRKRVILKVSDFRSAMVQGKMLAKKGVWVSEYRIESGLNCGGHAFAAQGNLMGPVLEEFKNKRAMLVTDQFEILKQALDEKNMPCPEVPPLLKISAQGGIGTAGEHDFLRDYYKVDSVGWGSPFLLVPEAVSIDHDTIQRLSEAREQDLYLSQISPLGVPFNNLRGNTKDEEKKRNIQDGSPGSRCLKHYCLLNTEFQDKPVCTASKSYQRAKLNSLDRSSFSSTPSYQKRVDDITEKSCICVGLGTSALLANDMDTSQEGPGVSVCPGPNMAYFSRQVRLKEMVGHIYGKENIMMRNDRPHMFIRELELYVAHFQERIASREGGPREQKSLLTFGNALQDGVIYYQKLFAENNRTLQRNDRDVFSRLEDLSSQIEGMLEGLRVEVPVT